MENDKEHQKIIEENLQLQAQLLLSDAQLEEETGIDPDDKEAFYEEMLRSLENEEFLWELTQKELKRYYNHVTESLILIDKAKEFNLDTKDYACLDESYRTRWLAIQKSLRDLIES